MWFTSFKELLHEKLYITAPKVLAQDVVIDCESKVAQFGDMVVGFCCCLFPLFLLLLLLYFDVVARSGCRVEPVGRVVGRAGVFEIVVAAVAAHSHSRVDEGAHDQDVPRCLQRVLLIPCSHLSTQSSPAPGLTMTPAPRCPPPPGSFARNPLGDAVCSWQTRLITSLCRRRRTGSLICTEVSPALSSS